MYDALGPDRAARLRERIASECDDMLGYLLNQGQQHKHSHNTGGARTFSAFGIAAMSIRGECEHAEEWLEIARDGVACWIEAGLDEDGGTRYATEGSYNLSAIDHVTAFVIAYRNVFGRDPCDLTRLRKYVLFILYKLEPQRDGMGQFGVFGRVGTYAPETIIALMALFDDGLARWFFDVYYGPDADLDRFRLTDRVENRSETGYVLSLLYWKEVPAEPPDTSPRLKRAALFRGSGKAVMRTGFENTDDLQLMIQCQYPQHGHSQAGRGQLHPQRPGGAVHRRSRLCGRVARTVSGRLGQLSVGVQSGRSQPRADRRHRHRHPQLRNHSRLSPQRYGRLPAGGDEAGVRRQVSRAARPTPCRFREAVVLRNHRRRPQGRSASPLRVAVARRDTPAVAEDRRRKPVPLAPRTGRSARRLRPSPRCFVCRPHRRAGRRTGQGGGQQGLEPLAGGSLEKKNPLGKSRLEKEDHLDFLERMKEEEEIPPFYIFGTGEPGIEGLFFTLLYPVRHGDEVPDAAASSTEGVVSMTIDGRDPRRLQPHRGGCRGRRGRDGRRCVPHPRRGRTNGALAGGGSDELAARGKPVSRQPNRLPFPSGVPQAGSRRPGRRR